MEVKRGVSKGIIFACIIIILLVVGIIVGAFYIDSNKPGEVYQETHDGGRISLTYSDEENLFLIENAIPTSDLVGTVYDSADKFYDFTVNIEKLEAEYIEYEILLVKDEKVSTAINNNIKVYLEKANGEVYSKVAGPVVFENNVEDEKLGNVIMSLYKHKSTSSGNDNYRLRMWLSDSAVVAPGVNQNYGVKIALRGVAK